MDYKTALKKLQKQYKKLLRESKLDQAAITLEEVVAKQEKVLGPDHPDVTLSLNNLAELYCNLGNYQKAEPLYKKSLEIREKIFGPDHPDIATSLNNLAELYRNLGDYQKAELLHKRSLEIREKAFPPSPLGVAMSLNNLAVLYYDLGDYQKAEPLYKRSLEIKEKTIGPDHPDIAANLNNLAVLYSGLGDYQEAEPLLKRSLEILGKVLPPNYCHIAGSINNLALLYSDLGDYQKAELLHKRSLEIREKTLGLDHPDVAGSLYCLAMNYISTGQTENAETSLLRAIHIQNRLIKNIMSFADENQSINFIADNSSMLFIFLNLIYKSFSHDPITKREAFDMWILRKGIVLEVQKRFQEVIFSQDSAEALNLVHSLSEIRKQLSNMYFEDSKDEDTNAFKKKIAYLEEQSNRKKAELLGMSDAFKTLETIWDANTETIAGLLPPDSVMIDFAIVPVYDFEKRTWASDHYFVFILPSGKPDEIDLLDLGEAEFIDAIISKLKKSIATSDDNSKRGTTTIHVSRDSMHKNAKTGEEAIKGFSRELAKKVFDPLMAKLSGVEEVYVSPDGQLNTVPFEILTNDKGDYLIDNYIFNYLATPKEIVGHGQTPLESKKALILGDPDFDMDLSGKERRSTNNLRSLNMGQHSFGRLQGTRQEVEDIFHFIGDERSVLYTDQDASEYVLMSAVSPQILHIATHGVFLEDQKQYDMDSLKSGSEPRSGAWLRGRMNIENPMLRSMIVLAGANTVLRNDDREQSEGIVTAEKILGLRLRGTDLVVLSACNTGLGDVKNGEGVFGLRRAFTQAGAKSIVMSMWKVPDNETRELMVNFYGNIFNHHMNRGEALRRAALSVKKKIKQEHGHTHPLFWAAFVFSGDPGNFPRPAD